MRTAPNDDRDYVQPHYIYRCYDEAGRLLYIGCTADVTARIGVHLTTRHRGSSILLQKYMHHYKVDLVVHAGLKAGESAERIAIRAEQPLLNIHQTGRPKWLRLLDLANYERSLELLALKDRRVPA